MTSRASGLYFCSDISVSVWLGTDATGIEADLGDRVLESGASNAPKLYLRRYRKDNEMVGIIADFLHFFTWTRRAIRVQWRIRGVRGFSPPRFICCLSVWKCLRTCLYGDTAPPRWFLFWGACQTLKPPLSVTFYM